MRVEKRKLLEIIHWVPATPNDVIIFYVISLVYVLSQKILFLGLATSFASITWPSSLFSDAQNRSYGCFNKVTAIRYVITDPVNDFNYCEIPASKQRTNICTLFNAVIYFYYISAQCATSHVNWLIYNLQKTGFPQKHN